MLEEIIAAIFVCGIPAAAVLLGWKRGKAVGRKAFFLSSVGWWVVVVITMICFSEYRVDPPAPGQAPQFPIGGIIGLIVLARSAYGAFAILGKRLKDASVPCWAVCIMGCIALLLVPYVIALFLPSKPLKETETGELTRGPERGNIMRHRDYAVVIPEGEEAEEGYVRMEHGTPYSIRLENRSSRRCNARIAIDGNPVGTFRIDQRSSIVLERPSHDTGRFTFFKVWAKEAGEAGIVENESTGLISVTFIPELADHLKGLEAARLSEDDDAGGTGLAGHSSQRFQPAASIKTDESEAFTIHFRLVAKCPAVRPLVARSTPIPPAVGT
ncbi:hypothetical protein [Haloferula sp. BvORR071]|uniref:hypothetical protein n=1 Tax=Haloferula sp. BvORR071 TaxID=1396141 RepID=UPI0006978148|nr:hypothetical protein [Haloferula sp. BvORR071]